MFGEKWTEWVKKIGYIERLKKYGHRQSREAISLNLSSFPPTV